VWNSLPDYLRDPAVSRDTFCKHLKTFLFAVYTDIRLAHWRLYDDALYKSTFYLLAYLLTTAVVINKTAHQRKVLIWLHERRPEGNELHRSTPAEELCGTVEFYAWSEEWGGVKEWVWWWMMRLQRRESDVMLPITAQLFTNAINHLAGLHPDWLRRPLCLPVIAGFFY